MPDALDQPHPIVTELMKQFGPVDRLFTFYDHEVMLVADHATTVLLGDDWESTGIEPPGPYLVVLNRCLALIEMGRPVRLFVVGMKTRAEIWPNSRIA